MFMMFGTLALYLTLFARAGVAAAVLAGGLLLAVLVMMARHGHSVGPPVKLKPWTLLGVFVLAALWAQPASAATSSCEKIAKRDPRYHHILAIDASGSVSTYFESMKALLVCYAQMYAAPDEEMTLVVFASDETGPPKELGTFKVPQSGSTDALAALLDDVRIQRPRATRTYFQPLAEFINRRLVTVRLDPIVLVLSDGASDAYRDAEAGRISFQEVPFESFAKRGLYSAPGMANWKVAIQGGEGIDLTTLFQRPLRIRPETTRPRRLAPALDPCLMDPDLVVETDDAVTLRPDWMPLSGIRRGTLSLRASSDCGVTRFRSFSVELIEDKKTMVLARFDNTPIGPKPRAFEIPLARPVTAPHKEATLRVILRQAETTRTIYPRQPEVIALNEVDYLSEFALAGIATGATLAVSVSLFAIAVRRRRARRLNAPVIVKSLDGPGVHLYPNAPEPIGDPDVAAIGVAGAPAGAIFGSIQFTGADNEFLVRPAAGFQTRVNGVEGAARYRLGQQIEFTRVHDGATFEVRLHAGTKRDVGWSTSPAGSVAVQPDAVFQGFNGVIAGAASRGPHAGGDGYI
jgi:hypothetical protein